MSAISSPQGASQLGGFASSQVIRNAAYPSLALIAIILAWFLVSWFLQPPPYVLPSPAHVWSRAVEEAPALTRAIIATTTIALIGLAVAVVVGLLLGFAIAWWGTFRRFALPPIIITQSIPKIALAPLFVVWFGYGIAPKLLVVILVTFYPILEACAVGVRSLPKSTFILSRSMGLSTPSLFARIILPASMPFLAGAFQVSASLALIGALTAEFVGAEEGIGVVLRTAVGFQDTALAFAGIILCAITGTLIYLASIALSRFVMRIVCPGYLRKKS
jgi:NitT/TauT family transport system permease protein